MRRLDYRPDGFDREDSCYEAMEMLRKGRRDVVIPSEDGWFVITRFGLGELLHDSLPARCQSANAAKFGGMAYRLPYPMVDVPARAVLLMTHAKVAEVRVEAYLLMPKSYYTMMVEELQRLWTLTPAALRAEVAVHLLGAGT